MVFKNAIKISLVAMLIGLSASWSVAQQTQILNPKVALTVQKAQAGDPTAQFDLGKILYKGDGLEQDIKNALEWFRVAAEANHVEAMTSLAVGSLKHDIGTVGEAIEWYEKAGRLGDAEAIFEIGNLYHAGQHVPEDQVIATRYFKQASKMGSLAADMRLGFYLQHGQGGNAVDVAKSAEHYEKAENSEDWWVLEEIAWVYNNRHRPVSKYIGKSEAKVRAAMLYHLAKHSIKHPMSRIDEALDDIYSPFLGLNDQLKKEVIVRLMQKAMKGNVAAMLSLGDIYAKFRGPERDDSEGWAWYGLALYHAIDPFQEKRAKDGQDFIMHNRFHRNDDKSNAHARLEVLKAETKAMKH